MNTRVISITSDNPIVKIESRYNTGDIMYVNWFFGRRCQFDCSYCPDEWHNKTSRDWTLDELKSGWKRIADSIPNKNVKFAITYSGGEPTISDNFLPFNEWLRENYNCASIQLTTNGTRPSKYYKRLLTMINGITFSIHSEFSNERKLFTNILAAHKYARENKPFHNSSVTVNFMYEPWDKERQEQYKQFFEREQIKYNIVPTHDFGEGKTPRTIRIHLQPYDFSANTDK